MYSRILQHLEVNKNQYLVYFNLLPLPLTFELNFIYILGSKDMAPSYHSKGASIERSTFNSRGDFSKL